MSESSTGAVSVLGGAGGKGPAGAGKSLAFLTRDHMLSGGRGMEGTGLEKVCHALRMWSSQPLFTVELQEPSMLIKIGLARAMPSV